MAEKITLELTPDEADRVKYAVSTRRDSYAGDVKHDTAKLAEINRLRAAQNPPLFALDRLHHHAQANRDELALCEDILTKLVTARTRRGC
jgi:hypothetical protein